MTEEAYSISVTDERNFPKQTDMSPYNHEVRQENPNMDRIFSRYTKLFYYVFLGIDVTSQRVNFLKGEYFLGKNKKLENIR